MEWPMEFKNAHKERTNQKGSLPTPTNKQQQGSQPPYQHRPTRCHNMNMHIRVNMYKKYKVLIRLSLALSKRLLKPEQHPHCCHVSGTQAQQQPKAVSIYVQGMITLNTIDSFDLKWNVHIVKGGLLYVLSIILKPQSRVLVSSPRPSDHHSDWDWCTSDTPILHAVNEPLTVCMICSK